MKRAGLWVVFLAGWLGGAAWPGAVGAVGAEVSVVGPRMRTQASWYGAGHHGLRMANGAWFDCEGMTCASWDYELGTRLRVRRWGVVEGGWVVVVVTDRGPARRLWAAGRRLDLARGAFRRLGPLRAGLLEVEVEELSVGALKPKKKG